jgi:hypothetical protein
MSGHGAAGVQLGEQRRDAAIDFVADGADLDG